MDGAEGLVRPPRAARGRAHDARPTTAMVLAAGLGTRMRPLTNDRPKALVEVGGKALIDHVLDRLAEAGVETRGGQRPLFRRPAGGATWPAAPRREIVISDERDELLETGGGLKKARPLLGDDPVFVANIDSVWIEDGEPGAGGAGRAPGIRSGWTPACCWRRCERPWASRAPATSSSRTAACCASAARRRRAPYAYMGVHITKPQIVDDGPDGPFSLTRIWRPLAEAGRIGGVVLDGFWMHVGDPAARDEAEARLMAAGPLSFLDATGAALVHHPGAPAVPRRPGPRPARRPARRARGPVRRHRAGAHPPRRARPGRGLRRGGRRPGAAAAADPRPGRPGGGRAAVRAGRPRRSTCRPPSRPCGAASSWRGWWPSRSAAARPQLRRRRAPWSWPTPWAPSWTACRSRRSRPATSSTAWSRATWPSTGSSPPASWRSRSTRLAARGWTSSAWSTSDRRVALLQRLAEHWADRPPQGVAGRRRLDRHDARPPPTCCRSSPRRRRARVVLPGLDLDLADDAWAGGRRAASAGRHEAAAGRRRRRRARQVLPWPGQPRRRRARRPLAAAGWSTRRCGRRRPPPTGAARSASLREEGEPRRSTPIAEGLDGLSVRRRPHRGGGRRHRRAAAARGPGDAGPAPPPWSPPTRPWRGASPPGWRAGALAADSSAGLAAGRPSRSGVLAALAAARGARPGRPGRACWRS